jgi:ABC-2 type transport system permease protein
MLNYIKSEIYRVLHGTEIYRFTAILAGLSFLLNAVLAWSGKMQGASFRYDTTSFSYSNLVSSPMLFCLMGALIGTILYEGNKKNGNLKNTIAFGIPRTKVFAGECIVTTITAIGSLVVILTVYIISAVVFLKHTGPVSLTDLLTEIPAVFLVAVASLISGIVCIEAFGKVSTGFIIWLTIWSIIPKVFFYMGFRFDIIHQIAMWMPSNFFGTNGMIVNTAQCVTAWETSEGLAKCLITGIIGIIIFSLSGVALLKKKDL